MKILSIETSADETAVSIVEAVGEFPTAHYTVLGNALFSQIEMHNTYGGIYPTVAKREHAKSLPLMLEGALNGANMLTEEAANISQATQNELETLLHRESDLAETLISFLQTHKKPDVDLIGVTAGPGLEPTLWVGINFAKALSLAWDIPIVPVNHMEGHLLVSMFDGKCLPDLKFPALGLLISGGHTEIDLMHDWGDYECVGQTRDDAIGEAFDKVARMLGLPYPGGPQISRLAEKARSATGEQKEPFVTLPRPMLHSDDFDFSFSGIKTAVRYAIEGKELSDADKESIALEFETAVAEVLYKKVSRALEQYDAHTVIIGGGVSANTYIKEVFADKLSSEHSHITLYVPEHTLSTDNAIMIALTAHARAERQLLSTDSQETIVADGNRALNEE